MSKNIHTHLKSAIDGISENNLDKANEEFAHFSAKLSQIAYPVGIIHLSREFSDLWTRLTKQFLIKKLEKNILNQLIALEAHLSQLNSTLEIDYDLTK